MTLPNTLATNVNTNVPMLLFPGGIQSIAQYASQSGTDTIIFVIFDEASVLNTIPANGTIELTVYGQLKSGLQFNGSDSVTIVH